MSLYTKIIDIQKMREAWARVKRNKPASGVDAVTYEEYDRNLKMELKQLHLELESHTYEVQPVKLVKMVKEEKIRDISLYTMRDKVVQVSIAQELNHIYEPRFSDSTFAYRNQTSAMEAVGKIEEAVKSCRYTWVCKTDIVSFFDSISLERLEGMLSKRIREEDVLELIMSQLRAPSVGEDGTLTRKIAGIYQGSSISPVLSNVYLDEFDKSIQGEGMCFIRYADDMLALVKEKEQAQQTIGKMRAILGNLGLKLNEDKTCIRQVADGFEFLGYRFNDRGKFIPDKAVQKLETGLEDIWLTMTGASLEERLKKGSQILNGWEQFYREERDISNLYEYVVLVYMMRYKKELSAMREKRRRYVNHYKDIACYLAEVWQENGWQELVILEYEQYFGIGESGSCIKSEKYREEIAGLYEKLLAGGTAEQWTSLMQAYADIGLYGCSERVMERIGRLQSEEQHRVELGQVNQEETQAVLFDSQSLELMQDLFVGREDMYTREILLQEGQRKCEFVAEPLTKEIVRAHMKGEETIGTYLVRNNDTVHYVVLDVDVSKKALLADKGNEAAFQVHLQHAAETAGQYREAVRKMGMKTYAEFSGYRGYHLWLFFAEWIPVRYAHALLEIIQSRVKTIPEDVTLECFPTKSRRKTGSAGQNIKLPYGIHLSSGRRSYFCKEDFTPVKDIKETFSGVIKYSLEQVKRVIGANISDIQEKEEGRNGKLELDYDKLGELTDSVVQVLKGCSLMQYLVHKAMSTGYLSHFERLSVLHVFGHIGEEGKEFVHTVMSFTLNYRCHVTQRFIDKLPAKPVSCIKLREQYKQVTAEYGCSCVFKRTKDCYPSPVIHALRKNNEENHEITIPTSRTITKAKQENVYEELNIHVKVQELAVKIVELKKQKRGINKAIKKVEKDLCMIFDNTKTDCMEVDMGILVRRKRGDEYEWMIEL